MTGLSSPGRKRKRASPRRVRTVSTLHCVSEVGDGLPGTRPHHASAHVLGVNSDTSLKELNASALNL